MSLEVGECHFFRGDFDSRQDLVRLTTIIKEFLEYHVWPSADHNHLFGDRHIIEMIIRIKMDGSL